MIAYILNNPVRAKLTETPEEYPYSWGIESPRKNGESVSSDGDAEVELRATSTTSEDRTLGRERAAADTRSSARTRSLYLDAGDAEQKLRVTYTNAREDRNRSTQRSTSDRGT